MQSQAAALQPADFLGSAVSWRSRHDHRHRLLGLGTVGCRVAEILSPSWSPCRWWLNSSCSGWRCAILALQADRLAAELFTTDPALVSTIPPSTLSGVIGGSSPPAALILMASPPVNPCHSPAVIARHGEEIAAAQRAGSMCFDRGGRWWWASRSIEPLKQSLGGNRLRRVMRHQSNGPPTTSQPGWKAKGAAYTHGAWPMPQALGYAEAALPPMWRGAMRPTKSPSSPALPTEVLWIRAAFPCRWIKAGLEIRDVATPPSSATCLKRCWRWAESLRHRSEWQASNWMCVSPHLDPQGPPPGRGANGVITRSWWKGEPIRPG